MRTSRNLSLTEAGRDFYESGARLIGDLEATESRVGRGQASHSGVVRVTSDSKDVLEASVTVGYFCSMKRNNKSKKKREAKRGGKLRRASKPARKSEAMVPLPAACEQLTRHH